MKKILIIGAGFLQAYVIKKARELGYFTLAVDADENAIGFQYADKYAVINIVDEETCLEYARKEQIDGVLTAATDYGVLTASYIAQQMGLPGLKYDIAKKIKNKYETRKCLFENHVDDTEQAFLVDCNTNLTELSTHISYPVMVKPCDGSGSRGASKVECMKDFVKACELAMNSSISHRAEIESFIDGKEYGAESLVIDGNIHVLAVMQKWMTDPPYYAELGHAIPTDLTPEMEKRVKLCVKNAIQALGINSGSVNMDLLITTEDKIHIVDIGARMGGNLIGSHIVPIGTGIDYMAAMIQNAVGDKVEMNVKASNAVVTRLLAFHKGVIKRVPSNINTFDGVQVIHHMHVGDSVNEYHTNLDGCGYVLATGSNVDNLIHKVVLVCDQVEKTVLGD
ncbi:ATP-grasp domain-containing protein [Clostridium facile]|uniref:ATP-grasp domain-containing protein n=1 Tax=Clostridium facile TaxID=2763035 RepID=A0ABR7INH7_9CLOT|nr:ATP-grasp domain-containing protein [Clostridium facile]MBC5786683.1 ATP-grasp domain-containing protein [Clostridium facile]